jgi:hypothetical protein
VSSHSLPKKIYGFVHGVFRKDIGRKLMALLLAVIVWVYVAQKIENSVSHRLSIRVVEGMDAYREAQAQADKSFFIVLPENVMKAGVADRTYTEDTSLKVTLSGMRDRLPKKLVGMYEVGPRHLGELDAKVVQIQVLKDYFPDLREAHGIRVRIDPPTIDVGLARREAHELILTGANNLSIVNKLPADLELIYDPRLVTFDPNPVVLAGPAPEIDRIFRDPSVFKLDTIDFAKVRMDSSLQLPPSDTATSRKVSIRTRDGLVTVNLGIREEEVSRDLTLIPVLLLDGGQTLDPLRAKEATPNSETVDIVLKGSPSALNKVIEDDIRKQVKAIVDLHGRKNTDTFDIDLYVYSLPEGIRAALKGESKMVVRISTDESPPPGDG